MKNRITTVMKISALTLVLFLFLGLSAASSLAAPIAIMPLGDSITRGVGTFSTVSTAYRRSLYLSLIGAGYDVDFVGRGADGVPTDFDRDHEGTGGIQDYEVANGVYSWLNTNPADIILLHIGTNNLTTNAADVERILDEIDRWEEESDKGRTVIVILARIINRQGHVCPNSSTTTKFNDNVEAMALNRLSDRIVIVDMECSAGLDYNLDMADLLHPTTNGFGKMADKWFVDGLLAILPQADAGMDQSVKEGDTVTLDGAGSHDPDGASLSYLWVQKTPGTIVTLSDPTNREPTFTAPEVISNTERLEFELTVTDTDGFQHRDTVFVDISNVLIPPTADAGEFQSVKVGDTVTLTGYASDPDGTVESVQWEQIAGKNQVDLTAPNELTTQFTAPDVDSSGDVLEFKLTVRDDDGLPSSNSVAVSVNIPEAPVTDAGMDQSVKEGDTVILTGSASDPDGTVESVQWEQIAGKNQVDLTAPNELTTQFTAPDVDSGGDVLEFKLTVRDDDRHFSDDIVKVTISPAAISTANNNVGSSGGGGCFIQSAGR